jgi:hypothetical protein
MDSVLDVLDFFYAEIFVFLPAQEIYSTVIHVCKPFFRQAFSPHFLYQILQISLNVRLSIRPSPETCLRVLKEIREKRAKVIEFLPVSTDGGADEDNEKFWFGHVFEYNEKPWCTLEGIRNANASGVLACTQPEKIGYHWATKKAVSIIRAWLESKGKKLEKKNEHIATAIFNHVVTNFPLDALVIDEENPEALRETIRNVFLNLRPMPFGIGKLRRYHDQPSILDMGYNKETAEQSSKLAAISKICISRKGGFTCPVHVLIAFASFKEIDILDPALSIYNNMAKYKDLHALAEMHHNLAKPKNKVDIKGASYCEFNSTTEELRPVLWTKFKNIENLDDRSDEIEIKLKDFVGSKFFYVKLVSPEDRRLERNWNHEVLNIDCTYVVPKGIEVDLS